MGVIACFEGVCKQGLKQEARTESVCVCVLASMHSKHASNDQHWKSIRSCADLCFYCSPTCCDVVARKHRVNIPDPVLASHHII